jgi:hypothetical protein
VDGGRRAVLCRGEDTIARHRVDVGVEGGEGVDQLALVDVTVLIVLEFAVSAPPLHLEAGRLGGVEVLSGALDHEAVEALHVGARRRPDRCRGTVRRNRAQRRWW